MHSSRLEDSTVLHILTLPLYNFHGSAARRTAPILAIVSHTQYRIAGRLIQALMDARSRYSEAAWLKESFLSVRGPREWGRSAEMPASRMIYAGTGFRDML